MTNGTWSNMLIGPNEYKYIVTWYGAVVQRCRVLTYSKQNLMKCWHKSYNKTILNYTCLYCIVDVSYGHWQELLFNDITLRFFLNNTLDINFVRKRIPNFCSSKANCHCQNNQLRQAAAQFRPDSWKPESEAFSQSDAMMQILVN